MNDDLPVRDVPRVIARSPGSAISRDSSRVLNLTPHYHARSIQCLVKDSSHHVRQQAIITVANPCDDITHVPHEQCNLLFISDISQFLRDLIKNSREKEPGKLTLNRTYPLIGVTADERPERAESYDCCVFSRNRDRLDRCTRVGRTLR